MNRIFGRGKILRGVLVLLIVAIMFLSTAAVAANISTSAQPTNIEKSGPDVRILGDVLLEEGFEDGEMPPPGGWTVDILNSGATWEITFSDVHYVPPAAVVYGSLCPQDEWLISPEIDLSDYNEVDLEFWACSRTLFAGATLELHIIGDDFDDVIWDMIEDEENWPEYEWRCKEFDLSEYYGETINISWRYVGNYGYDFVLDDILVEGRWIPPPPMEIKGRWRGFGKGSAVSAKIINDDGEDVSNVEWNISVVGIILPIYYFDNGTIPTIPSGGSETIQYEGEKPIYGLGKVNITVCATCAEGSTATKSVDGFVLFFFVIILP